MKNSFDFVKLEQFVVVFSIEKSKFSSSKNRCDTFTYSIDWIND
jgi:hypothetical protein